MPTIHPIVALLVALTALLPLSTLPAQEDAGSAPAAQESYLLTPFDQISLTVYDEPDLTSEQRISDEGTVSIPLLGEIEIGGLSVSAAQKSIEQAFIDQRYLVRPVVTINVKEFAPKLITVTGEVMRPGSIQIPPGRNSLPIQVAIAQAGGFTGAAQKTAVRVNRPSTNPETRQEVNVSSILEAGNDNEQVFQVLPEDIIFVPRRLF